MSSKDGMDIEVIRGLAKELKVKSDEIVTTIGQIHKTVNATKTVWLGADAIKFQVWWESQHRPAMQKLADQIGGLSQSLSNQAEDQDQATNRSGNGGQANSGNMANSIFGSGGNGSDGGGAMGGSSGTGTGVPGGSAGSGGAASGGGGTAGLTPAQQDWFSTAVGRSIDVDKAYGNQCVDVANDYVAKVFGQSHSGILGHPGYAKGLWDTANTDLLEKVPNDPNDPNCIPQAGDILIYGPTKYSPVAGHVAIVESASTKNFTVIEQNGAKPNDPAYRATYNYDSTIIGWLRPKV